MGRWVGPGEARLVQHYLYLPKHLTVGSVGTSGSERQSGCYIECRLLYLSIHSSQLQ